MERVLLVEDDPNIRTAAEYALQLQAIQLLLAIMDLMAIQLR